MTYGMVYRGFLFVGLAKAFRGRRGPSPGGLFLWAGRRQRRSPPGGGARRWRRGRAGRWGSGDGMYRSCCLFFPVSHDLEPGPPAAGKGVAGGRAPGLLRSGPVPRGHVEMDLVAVGVRERISSRNVCDLKPGGADRDVRGVPATPPGGDARGGAGGPEEGGGRRGE